MQLRGDTLEIDGQRIALLDVSAAEWDHVSLTLHVGSIPHALPADHQTTLDTARALSELHPKMTVSVGTPDPQRWFKFALGLLSLGLGVGLGLLASLWGLKGDNMALAAAPMIALVAIGLIVARKNLPWAPRPVVPITLLPGLLSWHKDS